MSACSPDTLTFLLIQTCKAHRSYANGLLGAFGLHAGQEMMLATLWREGGLSLSQLAERLEVQPPTVTRIVQRMEAGGLVERSPDPEDQRVSLICASAKGLELREQIEAVWKKLEARTTEGMTQEERLLFRRLLLQARENLGDPPV